MTERASFWDHLEVLRGELLRCVVAVVLSTVVAFCLKEPLFRLLLAPTRSDFFLYRWMGVGQASLRLVNTGLTEQMAAHLKMSLVVGVLLASPYILYVLFRFVSPALYRHERHYTLRLLASSYVMFLLGLAMSYAVVVPLTVSFLGTYQVSPDVENMLTLSSYIDTLMVLLLVFGATFQLPVMAWLLGRWGLLRSAWMRQYRRHAVVAVTIVMAALTPSTDVLTLLVVSLPICLLYEGSIWVVWMVERKEPAAPPSEN